MRSDGAAKTSRRSRSKRRFSPTRKSVNAPLFAVPGNEMAEDDVLAIVAPATGAEVDPLELLEFLKPRLAILHVAAVCAHL